MATKLEVTERREGIDEYDTLIVEVTDTGTIVRDIATVHAAEYADKLSAVDELLDALEGMVDMFDTVSKRVNWGKSFLNAKAISKMNLAPIKANEAIAKARGEQS